MSKKSFFLSSAGLKNIIFKSLPYEDQFSFFLGDKEIQMNRILAEFISPLISHIHQTDPTIDKIQLLSTEQAKLFFTSDLYDAFSQIAYGNKIEIDEKLSEELLFLSIYLNNEELFKEMNSLFPNEINEQNIDQFLKYIDISDEESQVNAAFFKESIIDFVSSHFDRIDKEKLLKINKHALYMIVCCKNLQLKDQDSLFDFINEIYSDEETDENCFPSKFDFYEKIAISELSHDKLKQLISNIEPNKMSVQLWINVKEFILNELNNNEKKNIKEVRNTQVII